MKESIENSDDLARRPTPPRTEEELLEREEHRARAGLRASAQGFGEDIAQSIGLRCHVERHPFATLTASAVGGFLLARPVVSLVGQPGGAQAIFRFVAKTGARLASLNMLESAISALVANLRKETGC